MNIRSLSLHHDEHVYTLASLKINFDVIGVSEAWDSFASPFNVNVEILFLVFNTLLLNLIVKMTV